MASQSAQIPGADSVFETHEVLNQPGSLVDYNAYAADKPLIEAVKVFEADWAHDHLTKTGACVGSDNVQSLALQANRRSPGLVKKVLVSLGMLLADAQGRGLVARNVVRDIRGRRGAGSDRHKAKLRVGVDIPVQKKFDHCSGRLRRAVSPSGAP